MSLANLRLSSGSEASSVMKSLLLLLLLPLVLCQSCDESQQRAMQREFTDCLNKHTEKHHENAGSARTTEEYQVGIQKKTYLPG